MVLPGKVAKETRAQFAGIIQRYMAGDESLHAEIQRNAESDSSIAQLARAGMEKRPASSADLAEGPAPKRMGIPYQMAAKVIQSNKQLSSAMQALPGTVSAAVSVTVTGIVGSEIKQQMQSTVKETGKVLGNIQKLDKTTAQIEKGVNKELKVVRDKNAKQEYCVAKLNETIRDKDAQIKKKDEQNNKQADHILGLHGKLVTFRLNIQSMDCTLSELKKNTEHLKADNAQLKAKMDQFHSDNAQLKAKMDQFNSDNAHLKASNARLEASNAQLTSKVQELINIFDSVYGTSS